MKWNNQWRLLCSGMCSVYNNSLSCGFNLFVWGLYRNWLPTHYKKNLVNQSWWKVKIKIPEMVLFSLFSIFLFPWIMGSIWGTRIACQLKYTWLINTDVFCDNKKAQLQADAKRTGRQAKVEFKMNALMSTCLVAGCRGIPWILKLYLQMLAESEKW